MKKLIILGCLLAGVLVGCEDEDGKKAEVMLKGAETELSRGNYRGCMDSIVLLRANYPKQIDAREKALVLWDQAELMQAQREVAKADSEMMVLDDEIDVAETHIALGRTGALTYRNCLRYKMDSVKARYDANCAIVRKLKMKIEN